MVTLVAVAVGGVAAAALVATRPRSDTRRRLARTSPRRSPLGPAVASARTAAGLPERMWLPVVAIVGCCVVLLMLGPLVTVAVASAEVFATMRLRALHRVEVTDHRPGSSTTAVEVPAALDVLAACLFAGSSLDHALTAVAEAFGGGVQATLAPIARLAAWGAPVETAWAQCLALPRWAPVARAVIRASYSGATLADVLTQQAVEYRRALRSGAAARAQRAGVSAVLPLGLCFLPAFVLAGIVPVVAGFAEALRH